MIQITKSMAFRIVSKANWRFFKLTYWGIFEAERTTGKNSASEGFGQRHVSDFANLAIHKLL
ncbi:hypothetical protein [Vibrio fortis]|uniref:hypothetical protein n=1 Tax=Vibrio fortis TaxID=212667 RepID=UPI0036F1B3AD